MSWGSYYGSHWFAMGLKIIWGCGPTPENYFGPLVCQRAWGFVFNLGPYDSGRANFNPKQLF